FNLEGLRINYVHAKRAAERVALEAARDRDVVVVNPSYLLGPGDREGSIMGRFCLRYWKGRVPLIPPGGYDLVDVRDVALGHLLAAEKGTAGRRYILGGENLSVREFVQVLAQVRGWSRTCLSLPLWPFYVAAWTAELRSLIKNREPYPSLQHLRL